jgi:hypothetical protein
MVENVKVVQVIKASKSLNKILSQFFSILLAAPTLTFLLYSALLLYLLTYVSFSLTVSIIFRHILFSFIIFVLDNQFNVFDLNFRP